MGRVTVVVRLERTLVALSLAAALPACTTSTDESGESRASQAPAPVVATAPAESAPAASDDPLASFARLVGGEWRVTFASGESAYHAWHWGPGKLSMRRMVFGRADGSDARNPWAGEVMYWHPGLRQVRLLSLHEDIPGVGRGVAEGTIWFDGETSEAVIDLVQPRGPRTLGQRQIFDGPDAYHEILLEDGGAGLQPLNAMDFVRDRERSATPSSDTETESVEFPELWKPFAALVGGTWDAPRDAADGSAARIRSTFAWEPSLEVVRARTSTVSPEGEATDLLDAYVYREIESDALACLALSEWGDVYQGAATVLDDGALQLDLIAHDGDGSVPQVARFEVSEDGRLRTRVWAVDGGERTLILDVEHRRAGSKRD